MVTFEDWIPFWCSLLFLKLIYDWQYYLCNVCAQRLSRVLLFAIPLDCMLPGPSFARQEYWSGLPFSSPGDLTDPGIEPYPLAPPAWAGRFVTTRATCCFVYVIEAPFYVEVISKF